MDFLKKLRNSIKSPKSDDHAEYPSEYLENTDIVYTKERQDPADEADAKEIRRILGSGNPPLTKATVAERLAKLEELRKRGIITEAEFERMAQEISKQAQEGT